MNINDHKRIRWNVLFRKKTNAEPNLKAHLMLLMVGVGHVLDGLVMLLSLGFVVGGFSFEISRHLSLNRMYAYTKKESQ
jgi:hypothetical protein